MSQGYVYILSNPSMPGMVKIGKTTRTVEQRCSELHQTGVPTPFVVEYEVLSPNCTELEAAMHRHLSKSRVDNSREFFRVSVSSATALLDTRLRKQVVDFVDHFLPDHSVIQCDLTMDEGHVMWLASECGVHVADMGAALNDSQPSHMLPILEHWRAKVEERKARRKIVSVIGGAG